MGAHGPWGGYGASHHIPWMGRRHGYEDGDDAPTKEELVELMERKKKRLLAAVEHLDKEIERLKTVQM